MFRHTTFARVLPFVLILVSVSLLACSLGSLLAQNPTPTPALARPTANLPAATNTAPSANVSKLITSVTMAENTQGDNKDPVNPTIVFAPDSVFHAVVSIADAPSGTKLKATWYAAEVGGAAAPNSVIDSYELTTEGTRNVDFTLSPQTTWAPGKYRVEVAVNGKLERIQDFAVSTSGSKPTVQPTTITPPNSTGIIKSVTMARDTQGDNKEPVNPTTAFPPSAVFHAVVAIDNAPDSTEFKASWYAVDVGSAAAPNSLIDSTTLTTGGSRNIDFTLTPNNQWPVGAYRVEIAVNGKVDQVVQFSVK